MSLSESPAATRVGFELELEVDIEPGLNLDVEWDRPTIERLVHSLVERHLPPGEYTLGLHLVGDQTIRELNQEHRAKDARTDVLSFPLHDPSGMRFVLPPGQAINLGDVVVAYPRVLAQAADFGHSVARELGYLVAHGVLHILGFDHAREADRHRMRQAEEEALTALGLTR
jgi:probable rRNA maturation factor